MGRIDRAKGQDATLERRHIRAMLRNIDAYEQVKSKKHPEYKTATEFYEKSGLCKQNFLKYYRRFIQENRDISALIPHKTGRKFKEDFSYTPELMEKIKEIRAKGYNRYDLQIKIRSILGIELSPSTIYRLMKKLKIHRLNPTMQEEKRKIVKTYAGEMGHIDVHYLTKGIVKDTGPKKLYLVGLIDDYSRICWLEVVDSIKALDVMFATMNMLLCLKDRYDITFTSMMSDNGSEFSSPRVTDHPFERMLNFYNIKHVYTQPCRPQTNGKIERFWKTLENELLDGEEFDTLEQLKEYILGYVVYYNEHRIHQGIHNNKPFAMLKNGTDINDLG